MSFSSLEHFSFAVLFLGLTVEISIDLKNRWVKGALFITSFLLCESCVMFTAATLMKLILFDDFAFPEILIYKSWTAVVFGYTFSNSVNHAVITYNLLHKVHLARQMHVLLNILRDICLLFSVSLCPGRCKTIGQLAHLECIKIFFMCWFHYYSRWNVPFSTRFNRRNEFYLLYHLDGYVLYIG